MDRRPIVREAVIVALLFGGFLLWIEALHPVGQLVASTTDPLFILPSDGWALVNNALVHGSVIVVGMIAFTIIYVKARDLSHTPRAPDRSDLPLLTAVALLPAVGVSVVYGLAHLTGTSISALTGTYVAADASLTLSVVIMGLGLFVGLPAYVLLAHALVQRTLRTATGPWSAVALTTVLIGFAGPTDLAGGGLGLQIVAVSLMLAIAIALPAYAAYSFDRSWLPWFCAIPLAVFATGVIVEWLAGLEGPAAAMFAFAEVSVVAIGGYAYERTDSLLAPAVAYLSFVVATRVTIFLFETGIRP